MGSAEGHAQPGITGPQHDQMMCEMYCFHTSVQVMTTLVSMWMVSISLALARLLANLEKEEGHGTGISDESRKLARVGVGVRLRAYKIISWHAPMLKGGRSQMEFFLLNL